MPMSLFEYTNYKHYLRDQLKSGIKSKFASAIGCQPSFLSQVLGGNPDLSLEQGLLANEFLGHTETETQFFMLLLQESKAGSAKLKSHFQKQKELILRSRKMISSRIVESSGTFNGKSIYYSSWIYPVIHVLVSIPTKNLLQLIESKTGLHRDAIVQALETLISIGLVKESGGKYIVTKNRLHIPAGDPLVLQHHRNFRAKVLSFLDCPNESNTHYSSVTAISKEDGQKIRDLILRLIEDSEKIIAPSKEETAYWLCLDFLEL
jgi:uncharacterized protein (TIGR02147 family)